jgi:hypothetical protein
VENGHTARQEKGSVVEKGDARLGGGHGDGTYMARIWRAREPASVRWELTWCSSHGLMSGMHDFPHAERGRGARRRRGGRRTMCGGLDLREALGHCGVPADGSW